MAFYGDLLGFRIQVEMPLPGNNRFVMVAPPEGGSNLVYPLIGLLEQSLGFAFSDSPEVPREKLAWALARFGLGRPSAVWLLSLLLN